MVNTQSDAVKNLNKEENSSRWPHDGLHLPFFFLSRQHNNTFCHHVKMSGRYLESGHQELIWIGVRCKLNDVIGTSLGLAKLTTAAFCSVRDQCTPSSSKDTR